MALASVRIELAPCLEAQNLQLWVTAVIDNVEQVDKDTPENLRMLVVLARPHFQDLSPEETVDITF